MTKKIKVGFYCQNKGYPNVDCRFPEKGNPGIGGTQFTEIADALIDTGIVQCVLSLPVVQSQCLKNSL